MYFIIVILKHPILWSAFMKNGVNISYIIIIKYPNKKAKHCIVDKKQISKSIIDDCDQGHHDSRNIGVNSKPLALNQWREATRTDKRWFKFKLSHSKTVNFEKVHQTFHRRCRDLNDLYQWNSKKKSELEWIIGLLRPKYLEHAQTICSVGSALFCIIYHG